MQRIHVFILLLKEARVIQSYMLHFRKSQNPTQTNLLDTRGWFKF